MIRKAVLEDVEEVMNIIRAIIVEMHSYNNYQWDENYPQAKDFISDIIQGDLYVLLRDSKLVASVCVNKVEPEEYRGLNWSLQEEAMVIHRMSVDPMYRGRGIGKELLKFAEDLAQAKCCRYLKADTNSINDKMRALFLKCGYNFIGEIIFSGKEEPFNCYDKVLRDV
jgi:GNAT superfamily N-acetyltransferase